jgi:hypothetical protein
MPFSIHHVAIASAVKNCYQNKSKKGFLCMRLSFFGAFLFVACATTASVRADALLQQALAPAADDAQRVWTVQRSALDYDADGHLKTKTVAQYDGTKPDGKRWSLLSVNGMEPSKSERDDFADIYKRNTLPPTYALVKTVVTANAIKLNETETMAHYRVPTLPAGSTAIKGLDLSKYTIADVTVDKRGPVPFICEVKVYAPKEFRPVAGGKVKRLERLLRFTMGKDGIPVLAEHSMTSDASILFKSITVRTVAQFSHQSLTAKMASASVKTGAVASN